MYNNTDYLTNRVNHKMYHLILNHKYQMLEEVVEKIKLLQEVKRHLEVKHHKEKKNAVLLSYQHHNLKTTMQKC